MATKAHAFWGGFVHLDGVAIIPARGGSKGLPRKNVRLLCGKPLIAWTIEAARAARCVKRVIVSTDDPEIAAVSHRFGAEVVHRPNELSTDTASSEAALIHALHHLDIHQGVLLFLQCTSPLTLPDDIDGTAALLKEADSAFTATPWRGFAWKRGPQGADPMGHSIGRRPMRQERTDEYLEVGAVYAMRIDGFLQEKRRFFGRVDLFPLPVQRSIEIDEEADFIVAEALLRRRLNTQRARCLPAKVRALVMDFDGVLTDNRVHLNEEGTESVTCTRADGWAISRLKEAGLHLLVLTNEANPVVRARCSKLGVECVAVGGEKVGALKAWLHRHAINPQHTIYIGNDVPDAPCMAYVGCGVAPADAYPVAKAAAQIVLNSPGGSGCIRELAELIFSIKEDDNAQRTHHC